MMKRFLSIALALLLTLALVPVAFAENDAAEENTDVVTGAEGTETETDSEEGTDSEAETEEDPDAEAEEDPDAAPEEEPEAAPVEKPSVWAAELVDAAIEAEIVPAELQSGYKQATTRAEFCALAVMLYEKINGEIEDRVEFSDTEDVNVQKAAAIGAVNGVGDGLFSPDAELNREQAATILARLAEALEKPLEEAESTFDDSDSFSTWSAAAVGQVQAAEIMSGVGDNLFSPKGPYTREQSIMTIMRLYNLVKE